MANGVIEALNGAEIVEDVLNQIKIKLLTSCDLRDQDSYGQGYSGEIKISLKLYGMDVTGADFVIPIVSKAEPPVSTEEITVNPVQVEETIEIPQELDLEVVRERAKESAPEPVVSEQEENRMPARLKRKYSRRSALEVPVMPQGGGIDITEE